LARRGAAPALDAQPVPRPRDDVLEATSVLPLACSLKLVGRVSIPDADSLGTQRQGFGLREALRIGGGQPRLEIVGDGVGREQILRRGKRQLRLLGSSVGKEAKIFVVLASK
jgi:hypothetical protein